MAQESVEVPLPNYIKAIACEAARTVIAEHVESCDAKEDIKALNRRVVVLEKRFNILIGAVIGSGALGGSVAAGIMKAWG